MKKTKLFHKILAFTLILSILFSMFVFGPVTFSAVAEENNTNTEEIDVWNGETADSFAGNGDGSEGNPYLIENGAQLQKMIKEYSTQSASEGKFFKITKDIYLNDVVDGTPVKNLSEKHNWLEGYEDGTIATPSKTNSFYGTLDGDGHTIYGLYAYAENKALGLFPSITNGTVIKNLNITNAFIHGNRSYGGAFAGVAIYYDYNYRAQLTNCSVTNTVVGQDELMQFAAGFVGDAQNVKFTFTDCYAYDNTFSDWYGGAGIVANDWNSGDIKINNCYSVGAYPVMSDIPLANDGRAGINMAVVTNTYTTVVAPEGNVTENITILNEDQMKGLAAKEYMTGFDFFGTWQTVENGYPVIRDEILPVWDGTKNYNLEGSGTEADPYLIKTASHIAAIATGNNSDAFTGKYFKLANDIRINDTSSANWKDSARNWVWADFRFVGTFDGDGHTIDGLYYKGSQRVMGLFSYVGADNNGVYQTTLKNFNMTNAYIESTAADGAGFAAGQASRVAYFDGIYIDDTCEINSTVKGAGGILGQSAYNIFMSNCAMNGKVVGGSNVGAFIGTLSSGAKLELKSSYTTANLYVQGVTDRDLATASSAVYAINKQGTVDAVVTQLTADEMKGEVAKTNMPGLSFKYVWETVENDYPIINFRGELWDGTWVTDFSSFEGAGTEESPYLIENGAQLAFAMVKNSALNAGTYYKLANDIILNDTSFDGWETSARQWVHQTANRWVGTLDGDGHTIEGLYMNTATKRPGLVSYSQGTFKNITFSGASINYTGASEPGVAIVAAQTSGATNFENIYVDETCVINSTAVKGVAALAGRGYDGTGNISITNCAVLAIINTEGTECGALAGSHWASAITVKISNSFSTTNLPLFGYTNKALTADSGNNYSVVEDAHGTTVLDSTDLMKGEAAKENMPGLSYRFVWETVDGGYPIINLRDGLWDGTSVSSHDDFEGEGTKDKPYLIENGAQLYFAAINNSNLTDGSYYKLVRDIVLNDTSVQNWEASANPWGMNSAKRFNGTLDGDGHTIEGLYINVNSTSGRYGLFSYVGQDTSVSDKVAEIKNITIKGASVTNTTTSSFEGVGIVAGQASGETIFENIYIDENCKVNAPAVKGVAGIVARSNQNVTITNCAVHGTYTGSSHVGSFLGTFWGGTQTISNSYSAANVPVTTSRTPVITNTYATVKLTEGTLYDKDVVLVDANNIKGEDAKTNMPGLDFDFVWKTVEGGYPVHRVPGEGLPAWNGSAAESLKGDGTKANPYKISNGAELYYMVSTFSNQPVDTLIENKPYFELTSDINLANQQWYNVGTTSYPSSANYTTGFAGVIYGNGHTVYNLKNAASVAVAGLIPVATQGTEIYDLHLDKGNLPKVVWNTYVVGGLIGLAVATNNSTPITISGCSVENYTIGSRDGSAAFVGDTYSQSLIIKDCYAVNNTISHTSETATMNTGAFVGIVDGNGEGNSIVIKNSYTDGDADIGYVKEMSTTFKNVYTTDETYNNTVNGLSKVTVDKITGNVAKTTLKGFNFNQIWAVSDGTPVHTDMDYRAQYFTGNPAISFASGTGTAEDPYMIETADQLYLLANLDRVTTLGKHYKLANDINISNVYTNWQNDNPFTWAVKKAYLDGFTYTSSFAGTLDGAGHTVSGLYYNNVIVDGGNYAYGLIPFVTADAVIKNITVSNVYAVANGDGAYVGAVAGAAHVMKEDIEANKLYAVQFVGVNVNNATIGATNKGDILGGASYGVKFDLCNTPSDNIHGEIKGYYVANNCNNSSSDRKDIVIVNNATAKEVYTTVRNVLLGIDKTTYISSIDTSAAFNVCDLFAAKKGMSAVKPNEYLVWSDEFNGNSINTSVWTQSSTSMSTGTTLEYANNATFDGNNIELNCYDTGKTDANGDKIYSINHGLHTSNTMSYKYGRLEMRAKIPVGAGAFPALWLSSRGAIGYIPDCEFSTEVDVFEVFGNAKNVNTAVACIHKWYNEDGVRTGNECSCGSGILAGNGYKVEQADRSTEISYEWCTVVFEWTEDTMTFSINGVTYYTAKRSEMDNFDISGYDTNSDGVFNQFMYPIITNHMYTTGAGAAYTYDGNASEIANNLENLTFEIDYIRLYQKNDGKSEINLK